MQLIKLQLKKEYVRPMLDVIQGPARTDGRVTEKTLWREVGDDLQVQIPLKEAGAWMTLLDEVADNIREDYEDDADALEIIANVIQEESEKMLGFKPLGSGEDALSSESEDVKVDREV
jgi:hypothetical protein